MNTIKEVVKDLTKLKMPVTATAAAAFIVTELPGTNIAPQTIAGVLVLVGVIASFVEKKLGSKTK